ncbi:MAG: glycosyltransferase [Armatimonadota bacterium]|nr:glycosyltransferase [Armatimonadota bacterium]MDW8155577.1 glycosyltransferase [Armatimonadota bacterium]
MQALPPETRAELRRVARADLVVGVPSFNNVGTVAHVVQTVAEGVVSYFPGLRAVILNADGGSTDGTPDAATSVRVPDPVRVVCTPYEGIRGKGSAVRAVLEAVQRVGARCCVLVDADLRSVEPWWVARLAGPVLAGEADYVAPLYVRHKYDGTITNNLAYPMTRALYGARVRQPIGGEFGLAASLVARLLGKPVWESDVARFGVDVWMTTTALCEGFRVVQAHLGAKVHDAKDPAASLGPMFQQVVGTLFSLLAVYPSRWRPVRGSRPVPEVGQPVDAQPEPVPVTVPALVERFRQGLRVHGELWSRVVSADVRQQLQRATEAGPAGELTDRWWARAVYDFAVAFHRDDLDPDAVLASLVPLYFGRVAAFVEETQAMDGHAAELVVERQAEVFEQEKPRLVAAWDRL